jgi:hypothetical protein
MAGNPRRRLLKHWIGTAQASNAMIDDNGREKAGGVTATHLRCTGIS